MFTSTCIVIVSTTEGAQGQKPEDAGKRDSSLKINFSVGVNMYKEKVTCDDQIRQPPEGNGTNLILVSLSLQPAKGRGEHTHLHAEQPLENAGCLRPGRRSLKAVDASSIGVLRTAGGTRECVFVARHEEEVCRAIIILRMEMNSRSGNKAAPTRFPAKAIEQPPSSSPPAATPQQQQDVPCSTA